MIVQISRLDIQKFRNFIPLCHSVMHTPAAARGSQLPGVFKFCLIAEFDTLFGVLRIMC
jgi:hypothetical protein